MNFKLKGYDRVQALYLIYLNLISFKISNPKNVIRDFNIFNEAPKYLQWCVNDFETSNYMFEKDNVVLVKAVFVMDGIELPIK